MGRCRDTIFQLVSARTGSRGLRPIPNSDLNSVGKFYSAAFAPPWGTRLISRTNSNLYRKFDFWYGLCAGFAEITQNTVARVSSGRFGLMAVPEMVIYL